MDEWINERGKEVYLYNLILYSGKKWTKDAMTGMNLCCIIFKRNSKYPELSIKLKRLTHTHTHTTDIPVLYFLGIHIFVIS